MKNMKYLIVNNKKYQVDFDYLIKNSQYFYRNQEYFKQVTDINILNEFDDGIIHISEEAIKTLIDSCQNEAFFISLTDIISLQFLSYKFEFVNLIPPIENIILRYSNELYTNSNQYCYNLLTPKSEKNNLLNSVNKEEILSRLFQFFSIYDKIKSILFSVFDRTMKQYTECNNQKTKNSTEKLTLLIKYLNSFRTSSFILFSFLNFQIELIKVIDLIILKYSKILNSTANTLHLSNILIKQQNELIKNKDKLQKILNQIDQKFDKINKQTLKNGQIKPVETKIKKENQYLYLIKYKKTDEITKFSIILTIKAQNISSFNITVNSTDLIEEIKRKIEQMVEIPLNNQHLYFNNQKLQDNEMVHHYSIKNFSVIDVIVYLNSIQIFVNFPKKKCISLNCQRNDLIKDLKGKIEKIEGIPSNKQQLLFCGKKLEDENKIQNYSIQDYSIIQVLNYDDSLILIHIVSIGFRSFRMLVKPTDLIKNIKDEIEKNEGIETSKQQLMLYGINLENDKSVQYYSIKQNQELYLLNELNSKVIKISKSDDVYCFVSVNSNDTYRDIKRKIELNECIPADKQHLFLSGVELENNARIHTKVLDGSSKITIVYEENLKICIRTPNKTINTILDIKQNESILSIKEKIANIEHIKSENQCLIFNGIELKNDKKVQDYSIPNYSIIQLESNLHYIKINICPYIVNTFSLCMKPTNFIKDIKAKIKSKLNIQICNQHLIFDEIKLDDKKRIIDYSINNDSKIDLLISLGSLNLIVHTLNGRKFELKVNQTDSIKDIKRIIEKTRRIPFHQQTLTYNGKKLKNNKTLYDYSINYFSEIELIHPKLLTIQVRLPRNKTVALFVKPNDKIQFIKEKICKIERIPINQQHILYNKKELDSDKQVYDYSINNNSTLEIKVQPIEMGVFIQTINEKTYKCNVAQINSIDKLKEEVEKIVCIPSYKQCLKFNGIELENDKTIQYYSIENDSKLILETNNNSILIHVKTLNGKNIQIIAQKTDLIYTIKRKIELKEKIPINKQNLIFSGNKLNDFASISNYLIEDKLNIYLFINYERIKLNIQFFKGKLFQIDVKKTDTIKSIKKLIQFKEKIKSFQQCLMIQRKELDDNKTIQDYNVQNGTTMELTSSEDRIQLFVCTTNNDKKYEISIDKNKYIKDLKARIEEIIGIPFYQILIKYNGNQLENDKTMQEYSIQHGSKIDLTILLNLLKLNIVIPSGKIIHIIADKAIKIINIKYKIEQINEIPSYRQILKYDKKELADNLTINDLSIKERSRINCEINDNILRLNVKILGGNQYVFLLNKKDLIKRIKERVAINTKIQEYKLCLEYNGKQLDDYNTIQYYSIKTDSTLNVIIMWNIVCLYIKMLNGKNFNVIINRNDPIKNIKTTIEDNKNIPIYQQKLIYNGKDLEDDKSIKDYSLDDEIKIYLIVKLTKRLQVCTNDGNKFYILVDLYDKITDVKAKIKNIEGYHESIQRLIYKGKLLTDNMIIKDCSIENESQLHLLHQLGSLHLLVRTVCGKQFYIDVDQLDLIENVKALIDQIIRIPTKDQKLIVSGKILENSKTIQDYSVCDYQVLYVFFKITIQILIDITKKKNVALNVAFSETIINIKERIEKIHRIPKNKQRMFYRGKLLEDDLEIQNAGIENHSKIYLYISE